MDYDYRKTEKELTNNKEEAKFICCFCGRLYKNRPFLCLCRSNCFLKEKKEK